jgi:hypothetical protein
MQDWIHGIFVWAVATLLTALMVGMAAPSATKLAAPSGEAGAAASIGETIIAYDLDRLFRSDRVQHRSSLSCALKRPAFC